jgi:hypothetical protein
MVDIKCVEYSNYFEILRIMKKILLLLLLSPLGCTALAEGNKRNQHVIDSFPAINNGDRGKYFNVTSGSIFNSTLDSSFSLAAESSSSYGVYLGYQFNRILSVEGGYTSLLSDTNVKASGNTIGTTSISGGEAALLINYPASPLLSPFIRVGVTKMLETDEVSAAYGGGSTKTSLSGNVYGIGVQFNIMRGLYLRVGYSAYNLKDTPGTYAPCLQDVYGSLIYKY